MGFHEIRFLHSIIQMFFSEIYLGVGPCREETCWKT